MDEISKKYLKYVGILIGLILIIVGGAVIYFTHFHMILEGFVLIIIGFLLIVISTGFSIGDIFG